MEACSGRPRSQSQIELEAATSDAGLAWCSRRRSIHRSGAEAERILGWLREQLAAAANVSVRSRRNTGAANWSSCDRGSGTPSCSNRPSLGSRAGGGFNNVRSVVISLARAGRAAGTVQCCSAPRPEACICKLGSGPLRERALRSDAADAIIDERNLLRHTDMKDRSPVMMRLQMLAHVLERRSWSRGCPLP